MRALKIAAAIIAGQCALGFAVGFTCPWLGFYLLRIGNLQTLLTWSIAALAPFALAIDAAAFAAIGVYAWRRRVARFARNQSPARPAA
jgi:hypothetical protein